MILAMKIEITKIRANAYAYRVVTVKYGGTHHGIRGSFFKAVLKAISCVPSAFLRSCKNNVWHYGNPFGYGKRLTNNLGQRV